MPGPVNSGPVSADRGSEDSVQAWLVDLDGTLYRPKPLKLLMAGELLLLGLPSLPVVRAFRASHEELREDPDAPAGDPFRIQLERTSERLGRPVEEIERVVRRWMVERPGKWLRALRRSSLLEEIATFRSTGGRTALVSDYPARAKLGAMGCSGLFDVVVASGEPDGPDRLKPDPAGYLLAAGRLGVEPAECLVLGDREDADGAAARAAGMAFRLVD